MCTNCNGTVVLIVDDLCAFLLIFPNSHGSHRSPLSPLKCSGLSFIILFIVASPGWPTLACSSEPLLKFASLIFAGNSSVTYKLPSLRHTDETLPVCLLVITAFSLSKVTMKPLSVIFATENKLPVSPSTVFTSLTVMASSSPAISNVPTATTRAMLPFAIVTLSPLICLAFFKCTSWQKKCSSEPLSSFAFILPPTFTALHAKSTGG